MPAQSDELELTRCRGALRDALGGLGNLRQLLQSLHVGPKAISAVLPAVRTSCAAIPASVGTLLDTSSDEEPTHSTLTDFIAPLIAELSSTLAAAVSKPMYAVNRLRLEKVVLRVLPDLESAHRLVELSDAARRGRLVRVELVHLVREAQLKGEARGPIVHVTLNSQASSAELPVIPQVAMNLLGLGLALVHRQDPNTPLQVRVENTSEPKLLILAEAGTGEKLRFELPRLIAPTLSAAQAAAKRARLDWSWDEKNARICLTGRS